ncbi:cytochrome P450 [Streptomyces sp. 11-1-2]|uniref:cytochrome P450 n=1 Tax=unclassified Streptomyces TaxID=2593676 RepID=UPI000B8DBC29|nr:cytochrome P450 [Streptomyces sp. 11-1-2]ASQ92053.1 cytochrome P450 [Streptomyces sp. 11-1-2]
MPLPPELDPAAVKRWRSSSGAVVDLLAQARELGGVSAVRLGPRPTVLVTAPEAVQHVLAHHPDRYVKRSHRARVLVGDGVLSATGEPWKRQRRLLQTQFTGAGIRRYEQRIVGAARRAADHWAQCARTGTPTDVGEDMRFFALDTIWRSLTGHPLDETTNRELAAVEAVGAALPTTPSASADAAELRAAVAADLARIDAVAEQAIAAARRGESGPEGPGLLRVLVDAGKSCPEYTDQLIRDELVTLLAAGHETTAKTLSWLYLLLDRHPDARHRALGAGAVGSPERGRAIRALVSETLRLYPAVWLIPRHATEDDTIAGYRVAAGTDIFVCPYLTHRDPALWPEPEQFDPERFTTADEDRRPSRHGEYYPFGIGARACLGAQFAMREMTVVLEHLLPAFTPSFHAVPTSAVFGITVRPDGPTPATITLNPDGS